MVHATSRRLLVLLVGATIGAAGCGRLYFDDHSYDAASSGPIDGTTGNPIDANQQIGVPDAPIASPPDAPAPDASPPDASPPDAAPACAFTCTGDLTTDGSTCAGLTSSVANGQYITTIDMGAYSSLAMTATVCNPTGWLFDLADSPTDNGFGGDSGTSMNDAEIQIQSAALAVYSNDYGGTATLDSTPNYIPVNGCSTVQWLVLDQNFTSVQPSGVNLVNSALLRINPPTDSPGAPDALWYLGVNTVVQGPGVGRTGTGVQTVTLCLN